MKPNLWLQLPASGASFILLLFVSCIWVGLAGATAAAFAQEDPPQQQPPTDEAAPQEEEDPGISRFDDKERQIAELIQRQKPQLKNIEQRVDAAMAELKRWEDTLKYREKIPQYRDQALVEVSQYRRQVEKAYEKLQELYFDWFRHTRHIMAVYTRYGELIAREEVDEDLKAFLKMHRDFVFQMEDLLIRINDALVQADFLLNSKLN